MAFNIFNSYLLFTGNLEFLIYPCISDLKPENLLLDFHKRIKIVDFGLSNVYKDK